MNANLFNKIHGSNLKEAREPKEGEIASKDGKRTYIESHDAAVQRFGSNVPAKPEGYNTVYDNVRGVWAPNNDVEGYGYEDACRSIMQSLPQGSPERQQMAQRIQSLRSNERTSSWLNIFNDLSGVNQNSTRNYGMNAAGNQAENDAIVGGATAEEARRAGNSAAWDQGIKGWATGTAGLAAGMAVGYAAVFTLPALLAKAGPLLAKFGIRLGAEALKKLFGELASLFQSLFADNPELDPANQMADNFLQFDVKNLVTKAQQQQDAYSKSVATALSPLANRKNDAIKESVLKEVGWLNAAKAIGSGIKNVAGAVGNALGGSEQGPNETLKQQTNNGLQFDVNNLYQKTTMVKTKYSQELETAMKSLLQGMQN